MESSEETLLPRKFGFWTGWFVVFASTVGSGILTNSGPILKTTSSPSSLLILWLLGGLLALAGALSLAEMTSGIPQVGGEYTYVRMAYGRAMGFVYGWGMLVIGFCAPIALISYTTNAYVFPALQGVPYFSRFLSLGSETFMTNLGATALITLFTFFHCLGQASSRRLQHATTLFNLCLLTGFGVLGLCSGQGHVSNISSGAGVTNVGLLPLATGMVLVSYAYTGWNGAAYIAGEVINPKITVPRCLIFGCLGITLLYVLVNLVYVAAIPIERIHSLTDTQLNRIAEVSIEALLGTKAARLFSFLFSMGAVAGLSAYILTGPRVAFAMARDGLFPEFVGKLHKTTLAPVTATLAQSGLALLFLWSGTFQQVLTFTGYGLSVMGVMAVAPIFMIRRRPDFSPAFRVPFYPWTPLFFVLVYCAILIGSFLDNPKLSALSLIWVAMGFPLYWLIQKARVLQPVANIPPAP